MKISLFIMEDNQISGASHFFASQRKKGERRVKGEGRGKSGEGGEGALKRKGLKQQGCNQYTAGSVAP